MHDMFELVKSWPKFIEKYVDKYKLIRNGEYQIILKGYVATSVK